MLFKHFIFINSNPKPNSLVHVAIYSLFNRSCRLKHSCSCPSYRADRLKKDYSSVHRCQGISSLLSEEKLYIFCSGPIQSPDTSELAFKSKSQKFSFCIHIFTFRISHGFLAVKTMLSMIFWVVHLVC